MYASRRISKMSVPAFGRPTESQRLEAELFVSFKELEATLVSFLFIGLSQAVHSGNTSAAQCCWSFQGICDMIVEKNKEKGKSEEKSEQVHVQTEVSFSHKDCLVSGSHTGTCMYVSQTCGE